MRQVHILGHSCTGSCICAWGFDANGKDEVKVKPDCPISGSGGVFAVAFSSDGQRVVCGCEGGSRDDGVVKVCDAATGAEVRSFVGVPS